MPAPAGASFRSPTIQEQNEELYEMDDRTFQQRLTELAAEIEELPAENRDRLRNLCDEAKARQDRMKQMIGGLTESLDYLRLSVKYLVFDLEATRRENKYLRGMIERQQRDHRDDDGNGF